MNSNLIFLKILILIVSLGGLSLVANAKKQDEGWIPSSDLPECGGVIWTKKVLFKKRSFWFRNDPNSDTKIQIKSDGRAMFQKPGSYTNYVYHDYVPACAKAACNSLKGTGFRELLSKTHRRALHYYYPKLINASCVGKEEWGKQEAFRAENKEKIKKQVLSRQKLAKQRLEEEKAREVEKTRKLAASSLAAKKSECTSFGFEPETPDHAECVMKMAIAEKARNKSESQANAIAEESAAAAAAYQAKVRRAQAQQAAANREAREAAKRQREAQLLINLGGAISSGQFPGGSSSGPAFSDEPMPSSGRYKECFYRVAGDRLSVSIPRAEGCPATRTFGSVTGYLTR